MSAERRHDEAHSPGGYETTDAHEGATYRAGLYILAVMVGVAVLLVPAFRLLARREAREQPPPRNLVRLDPSAAAPAFPKLVTSEPLALARYRAKEDAILDAWGWVEKDRGIARMPVAEALRIVGARGALPAWPAPTPGQSSTATPPPSGAAR